MLWLHGGGFDSGTSAWDPGQQLAKKDVVVVSVNHRLNILGFLDLSAVSAKYKYSGNVGVLDLSLLYGHTGGRQRGLQLGAVNVAEGPLEGVQIGLLASVSGVLAQSPSTGAQAALAANYSDSLDGLQLALAFNRAGAGSGLQLAAGVNSSDRFRGIQVAAVNIDGKEIRGAQIGAINAGAETFSGLQFGAINGCSGTFSGLQAGLLNTATTLDGVQFGLFNLASTSRGWQIGLYNDARHAQGVQIGLANWSSDADLPLLPLVRASF